MLKYFICTIVLCLSLVALAGTEPCKVCYAASPDAGTSWVGGIPEKTTVAPHHPLSTLWEALKKGNYREFVAGTITLLVFFWRRFGPTFIIGKIPNKYLPFVTAGVALLTRIPLLLVDKDFSWDWFALEAFITGAEAIAFWSMVGKFVLPTIIDKTQAVRAPKDSPPRETEGEKSA